MKKILLFFTALTAILFPASSLHAGIVSTHLPRSGDRLRPGVADSRYSILSADDSLKTVLLDPSAVSYDGAFGASVYISGDTVSYIQFATKHRFLLRGDTLSYLGFENRATDFRPDTPVRMALLSLRDGERVRDTWKGHVTEWGSLILKRMTGISTSFADRGWTITDGTDTVAGVTRLRWILDMSYADPEVVTTSMPDSAASDRISELRVDPGAVLSERLLTERTIWFQESARYPILAKSRVSRVVFHKDSGTSDTVPVSQTAIHYPAHDQYSDLGEDPAVRTRQGGGEVGAGYYGDSGSDNTVSAGEPSVTGNSISVVLSSEKGNAVAVLTLFSDSGIRLADPVPVTVGTVPQSFEIDIPSGWKGVLILSIETGKDSFTKKVII